jgi:uncharacterized damage-inducible protein DinB
MAPERAMKTILTALYAYGEWANERLLTRAVRLSAVELGQKLTKGADAILPTFGHLVGADVRWLARWRGETPPALSPADFPTLDAVRDQWAELYRQRRSYLATLDESRLGEPIHWTRVEGPATITLWQAIVQCANHGTQHRSEIAAMLTELGHSPGDMDFSRYCLETAGRQG